MVVAKTECGFGPCAARSIPTPLRSVAGRVWPVCSAQPAHVQLRVHASSRRPLDARRSARNPGERPVDFGPCAFQPVARTNCFHWHRPSPENVPSANECLFDADPVLRRFALHPRSVGRQPCHRRRVRSCSDGSPSENVRSVSAPAPDRRPVPSTEAVAQYAVGVGHRSYPAWRGGYPQFAAAAFGTGALPASTGVPASAADARLRPSAGHALAFLFGAISAGFFASASRRACKLPYAARLPCCACAWRASDSASDSLCRSQQLLAQLILLASFPPSLHFASAWRRSVGFLFLAADAARTSSRDAAACFRLRGLGGAAASLLCATGASARGPFGLPGLRGQFVGATARTARSQRIASSALTVAGRRACASMAKPLCEHLPTGVQVEAPAATRRMEICALRIPSNGMRPSTIW